MIEKYKKYKDLEKFINNQPISNSEKNYSLVFNNCTGLSESSDGSNLFNDNCFGCLFCSFGILRISFISHFGFDNLNSLAEMSFKKELIKPIKARNNLSNPYRTLEFFTKTAETKNIQPWVAGLMQNTCSNPCRVSMEINAPNESFNRDGRIDVCVITDSFLMAIETKTSLDDALNDERFVDQYAKYMEVIEEHRGKNDYVLLILVGGKETDLLPSTHAECTGKIGNKSNRFYNLVSSHNIKFISANALWALALKYFMFGKDYQVDKILKNVFSNEKCIGLLTSGKIMGFDSQYSILEL